MTNALKRMAGKPRSLTKKDHAALTQAALVVLTQDIEELEQRARCLGLTLTARGLNQAKNACGWERTGNSTAAAMALKGETPR